MSRVVAGDKLTGSLPLAGSALAVVGVDTVEVDTAPAASDVEWGGERGNTQRQRPGSDPEGVELGAIHELSTLRKRSVDGGQSSKDL